MIIRLIVSLLFAASVGAQESNQATSNDITSNIQSMTNFAKNALMINTNLAKKEFNMEEEPQQPSATKIEDQYKSKVYRDIFFPVKDSAMINQAIEYYKQGKKMRINEDGKKFETQKVETVRKPLVRLSSIMYQNPEMWSVFSSAGKFNNTQTKISSFEITGISKDEVEFSISLSEIKEQMEMSERVVIEGEKVIVTLRTGECIFENDLKITKNCRVVTEMVDKKIEVK